MAKTKTGNITELRQDDRNANKHKERGKELLQKSIGELGAGRSVLVDANNVLIAGNSTTETAIIEGITKTIVVETTGDELVVVKRTDLDMNDPGESGRKARQMALIDNAAALEGIEWDREAIEEIESEWGFEAVEWGVELGEEEAVAPSVEEDEGAGALPKHAVTVKGDVWELISEGKKLRHRIMCGDSTDSDAVSILMDGVKVDFVFTSPPYNGDTSVGFAGSGLGNKTLYEKNETDNKTSEDYVQFNSEIFSTIKTIAADNLVILYNINYNRNSPSEYIDVVNSGRDIFNLVETIVWKKHMAISLAGDNLTRIFEFIFVFFNGEDKPKMNKEIHDCVNNFWEINNVGANHEIHKACFPIELVSKGINLYAPEKCSVFEPFTGSGTTLIACEQLNRNCYGMELDEKYCDVIVRRWIAQMEKDGAKWKVLLNGQERADVVAKLLEQNN